MTNPIKRPTQIVLDKTNCQLVISWSEEHKSVFPFDVLYNVCPCAVCREQPVISGPDTVNNLIDLQPIQAYLITAIKQVGNYALQFTWNDEHNSGIYTWDYLYSICNCEFCQTGKNNT